MTSAYHDHEISEFFDRCARQRLMYEFEPMEQQTLRQFFELWEITPGMRVLEPGCGAGRLTVMLADAVGPQGEVMACDLSSEMIRLAEERGLSAQVCTVCGPVTEMARPAGWFDRIICLNVFPHFTDKQAVLREFRRLLKPQGALWINHFEGRESLNHFHHHAAPEVAEHALPCPCGMRHLLEEAGFDMLELVDRADAYWVKAIKRECFGNPPQGER